MRTAIILHGMPSKEEYLNNPERLSPSNEHWLPWLQQQLIGNGVLAQTPEFPEPYAPDYEKWREAFERFPVDEETMLIGHSCGAGFLARWLSEHAVNISKIALVAPWLDPEPRTLKNGFFEFEIDSTVQERTESIAIFSSADDDADIHKSAALVREAWPKAQLIEFEDKGHFTHGDMKTEEFPELRDYLLIDAPPK